MNNNIFEPLQLSSGSHKAGSGRGCAMNVISWENGDKTITDYPKCSDRMLSRIVQGVNDKLADSHGYLSPVNSIIALDLGHATVGTSSHNLSEVELKKVYVKLAILAARKVSHLNSDPRVEAALVAAENWVNNPTAYTAAAAAAAYAAAYAAAADADAAAAYAAAAAAADVAVAAAYADAADVAVAAAYAAAYAAAAADAAAAAAYADAGIEFKINLAWELINEFKRLTGVEQKTFDEETLTCAVEKMLVRSK